MPIAPQITNTPIDITSADFAITAVSHTSSTATYTASGHTFSAGDTVIISGIVPAGYSGTFTISSVVAGTSFTCANTTNLAVTTATGDAFTASNTDFAYADVQQVYQADIIDVTTATSAASAAAAAAQATADAAAATAGTAQSTATAAQSSATTAYNTAIGSLQPSANTIVNSSNQITAIASNGITVYSGSSATSGARVVMNSAGLAGYDASNNATFSITASTGAAVFSGSITGSTITGGSLNIAGNTTINYLGNGILIASGATITGTINAQAGYFGTTTNGFSITSTGLTGVGTGTISGGTIKTSGSSNWVQMAGSTNSIDFYTDGTAYAHILPTGAGGAIWHYGTTPDASSTNPQILIGAGGTKLSYDSSNYVSTAIGGVVLQGNTNINGTINLNGTTNASGMFTTGNATASAADTVLSGIYSDNTGYLFLKGNHSSLLYIHNQSASTATNVIQFYASGTAWGGIKMNGSASAPTFFTGSDYRLKENIQDYTGAIEKIKALRVVSFNEKTDPAKKEIVGFIADEFATVFPEWVEGEKDAVDEDGKPIYQSIATTNLINYLVGAVKESVLRIEKLEGK